MKKAFALIAILTLAGQIFAVENKAGMGSISGKIVDGNDSSPVEFTSIAVFKQSDSSLVQTTSSSNDGTFKAENIPSGVYKIKVSFVGYKVSRFDSVHVAPFRNTQLADIKIFASTKSIDEVVVKGERSVVESKIDRKVFYVDKNITALAGTATDVLQQVPSVQVDAEGNVSLRGSENVTVMVNGKPTLIDKNIVLQQIPANNIEKIEVITNPSAKYDPDGTSGIINVVLKQGAGQGINTIVTLNAGTKDGFKGFNKYNGNINFNYNPGKLNFFVNMSYRDDTRFMSGRNEQRKYNATQDSTFSLIDGTRNRNSWMGKVGFDYNLSKQTSFGSNFSINTGKSSEDENFYYEEYSINKIKTQISDSTFKIDTIKKQNFWKRNNANSETNSSYTANAYMLQKFNDNGHELKLDYTFDSQKEVETTNLNDSTLHSQLFNYEHQEQTGKHFSHITQLDYSLPINEKLKFEAGFKSINRQNTDTLDAQMGVITGNLVDSTITDSLKTYNFKYNENLYSLYSTFSLTFGNFSAMLGLRLEMADNEGRGVTYDTTTQFPKKYNSFFPTLHMAQKINDNNEVTLSYSRRINRPNPWDMNPITDYSNALFWRVGNPDLNPEYINSFEGGYTFKTEKFTFQPTLFYRLTQHAITREITIDTIFNVNRTDTSYITKMRSVNMNKATSYGVDLAVTYQPFKFWNINLSGSLFEYKIFPSSTSAVQKENFGYNGKIMSNTMLPMGFAFQISAFYRSPFITPQGKSDPFYSMNLGLRKDFLKGKLTGSLTFSDVFNTMHMGMDISDVSQYARNYRKRESQTVFVGLTYKFGKAPKNNKKRPNGQGDENGGGEDMMF